VAFDSNIGPISVLFFAMKALLSVHVSLWHQTKSRCIEIGLKKRSSQGDPEAERPKSKKRRRQVPYGPETVATMCPLFSVCVVRRTQLEAV